MAGGDVADGEVPGPAFSVAELQSILNAHFFRKRVLELGVDVRIKKLDGTGHNYRRKPDVVEDYRRQLEEFSLLE